jgi:hypothetical protein
MQPSSTNLVYVIIDKLKRGVPSGLIYKRRREREV